jgi:hypothetical protein
LAKALDLRGAILRGAHWTPEDLDALQAEGDGGIGIELESVVLGVGKAVEAWYGVQFLQGKRSPGRYVYLGVSRVECQACSIQGLGQDLKSCADTIQGACEVKVVGKCCNDDVNDLLAYVQENGV